MIIQDKKIALITGAGSGIGSSISIELAKKNIHTIITDKSLTTLKNTENIIIKNGGTCTVAHLDMSDFLGIDRLGLEIFKRWKKLDILIANAAILGTLGPLHHQSNEEFSNIFNINLLSNHRLIRCFDAIIKNSLKPKALFLSSSVSSELKPFWGAYSVSKAALEHMVKLWSIENKHNNLSIFIIDPGKTNTKMRNQAVPGEKTESLQDPLIVGKNIVKLIFSNTIYKGDRLNMANFKKSN